MSPLPKRCCARCGFLYGLASHPASREDAVFDPDLIRSEDYPPSPHGKGYKSGVITSQPYFIQRYWRKVGDEHPIADPPEVRNYNWGDTLAICCYMKKFTPTSIHYTSRTMTEQEIRNLPNYIPTSWTTVEQVIRRDRQDCEGFFEYHPGYTPAQHVELLLEEKRIQRAEAHERQLAQWSIEQERRLAEWSNSQESRWRRFQAERENEHLELETTWKETGIRLAKFFGILGLLFTGLEILAAFLIAKYLP